MLRCWTSPVFGDTRFAPFDATSSGELVATLYLAEDLESALLETSLHNASEKQPRVIDEQVLLGKLHARVVPPHDLHLIDLRDHQLQTLDLVRENISSSSPEHYSCTRRVARAIHAAPSDTNSPAYVRAHGMVWRSRQAELTGGPAREVAVIFADRVATNRGSWRLARQRSAAGSLLEGAGKLVLDELADHLRVDIETSSDLDD